MDEVKGFNRKEKREYMMNKIRNCVLKMHADSGYISFKWEIGRAPQHTLSDVCRKCFMAAYEVGHSMVDTIVLAIKRKELSNERSLNDTSGAISSVFATHLERLATSFGIQLSTMQISAMKVPNTEASLGCFAWMHMFFDLVGDKESQLCEIHLDPQPITTIHREYKENMLASDQLFIGYTHFVEMWHNCFPHVKIRQYKACTGKCEVCANLSDARKQKMNIASKRYISELHALHRSFYMGERLTYYKRRCNALLMPSQYLSLISDGMQQTHCQLPWAGNLFQFDKHLPQHLQGVLKHGRAMEIYRTFHNVRHGANLSLHCFLLALEVCYIKEGLLPNTIYYQVENNILFKMNYTFNCRSM